MLSYIYDALRHKGVEKLDRPTVHTFFSSDGTLLKVRPLLPEDAHYLVDLFEHMGPDSRFLRFNVVLPNPADELVWSEARRLARVDPVRDGAWLVFVDWPEQPDTAVAGARYIRVEEDVAEASLAVRDDMQNKGIGTELLRFLVEQARTAGIRKLVATIQRANRPLLHLLKKSDLDFAFESEGSYTVVSADLTKI